MLTLRAMRRLDSLVGIPAVYLLKAFYRVFGLNRRRTPDTADVKNVLLIKCFGMGSLILERPFLHAVRQHFPSARIHLLTFENNRPMARLIPELDEVHYLQTGSALEFARSFYRSWRLLRRAGIDLSFDQEFFSKFTTLCSLVVGAPWRIGFYLQTAWRENAYTHSAYFNSTQHAVLVFLAQLKYALVDPKQVNLELDNMNPSALIAQLQPSDISAEDEAMAAKIMEQSGATARIAVNVNSGELSYLRRWPREKFVELIRELLAGEGNVVYLTGSPSEASYVASVAAEFQGNEQLVDLSGQLSIPQLMAFLKHADLLISNDSGPLHMAAVMGTDTISVFGPETPALYGPAGAGFHQVLYRHVFCSPCLNAYNNKLTNCTNNVCVKEIGVSDVLTCYVRWEQRRASSSEGSASHSVGNT